MTKHCLSLMLVLCLVQAGLTQVWTFESDFKYIAQPHSVVVDPEGKIWVCTYAANDSIQTAEGVWKKNVKALKVYNPDGTQVMSIKTGVFDGEPDTLYNGARGLTLDKDGNILYSAYDELFKFNYKTGEGMKKVIPKANTSLTEAAVTDDGYIFVGHVAGGNPIWIYDSDFNLYSVAEDTNVGLQRSILVSGDGKHIYLGKIYSGCNGVVEYYGPYGVAGEYRRVDTLGTVFNPDGTVQKNMWAQCLDWDKNGLMWVGTYWDVGVNDFTGWYALDPTQDFTIVDSVGRSMGKYVSGINPEGPTYFAPRGAAWSGDGHTLYTADFDGGVIKRWFNPNPIKPSGVGGGGGEPFLPDYPIAFRIKISVSTPSLSDNENFAGTAFGATDGFDYNFDLPEPPPPYQNYLQLYFPHTEWGTALVNFSSDVQEPVNLNYSQKFWYFTVATDQVGQLHTIRFTQTSGPNLSNHIFVKNMTSGETKRLSSGETIEFTPMAAGEYRFQLMVGRLYPVQEIATTLGAGWNMISLPLVPLSNSVNGLFGDDITSYYYPYTYSNTGGYLICSSMQMGKGYWLGLLNPATVDFVGDSLYNTITVMLPKGSNLIGNPFKYKIGKENIRFYKDGNTYSFTDAVGNNWISAALHHWNNSGSGYYSATDTLGMWWGAWLYVLTDGVRMEINPTPLGKSLAKASTIPSAGWLVHLNLKADWGGEQSSALGVHPDANPGFDALYDYPEPPAAPSGKFVQGYFCHPGWMEIFDKYDRDIRPETGASLEWEYTVSASQKGPVRLTWCLENVPADLPLTLSCPELNLVLDMRQEKEYTFVYERETTFRISAGSATGLSSLNELPDRFALCQNYPNPFNPVTTIRYQLPEACNVELTIYNALGQVIQTLVDSHQAAGYYAVSFDASRLSSGIYFYRLRAGEYQELRKCVVVK